MTLSDLKKASAARQEQEAPAPAPAAPGAPSRQAPTPADGRTKMLGARVPLAIHREFQQQLFRAQEDHPDLTMQDAVPALIRLLRDEQVWARFLAELENP